MPAVVTEIYTAPSAGDPMQSHDQVECVAYRGIKGDRYLRRTGYWSGTDECEVTLIESEALDEIRAGTDVSISNGEHRRNIVTRGVRLYELTGQRFELGEAVLEFDRPRPPCAYIQSLTERLMTRVLGGTRGGICARVVKSGMIRLGDAIKIL